MSEKPEFVCSECEPELDVTAQVLAERDEQMLILRSTKRSGEKWSVVITCPKGHELAFDGTWE